MPEQIGDLPKIGRPAAAALLNIGVDTLAEVAALGKKRVASLHGVGPKAIRILEDEMQQRGIDFAD
ncbi:helix-hairpin-helix domain-containing protein [Galactobacter sp.]|uniref:helix-hairpin-helix domain-containing protein n=1 Tax=Galactobacter sp. TaxID=2676125 RepID=UPI0025C48399|nr:helix-hairpin-helix domain-containing protein [Galactobacter sp.]